MRIIADRNIPLLPSLFEEQELVQVDAREISADLLSQADALIVRSVTQVDSRLLTGSSVRFVATATSGVDHVDLSWLTNSNIAFSSAAGANATAVADYVMAAFSWYLQRAGKRPEQLRCGIVGVGHVGAEVLRRFRALGCVTLACDPPRQESGDPLTHDFEDLSALSSCDVVSLHVPLNSSERHKTAGLIDGEFLGALPDGALLINTSRGGVLNEMEATHTLTLRKDIHLVLDVFEGEPHAEPDLVSVTHLITPHIAGYSRRSKHLAARQVAKALMGFFDLDIPQPGESADSVDQMRLELATGKPDEVWQVALQCFDLTAISDSFKRGVRQGDSEGIFDYLRKQCSGRPEYAEYSVGGQMTAQASDYLAGLGFAMDRESDRSELGRRS
ncbi:MAG: 4-phosphoerythronate dehydrogenase [Pseudomonadota bacterium]|nr:4-phosphoerythronate dehydrogenase [Pseudomonadota bacterium]